MTHWMVRFGNAWAAFKSAIKQAYENDKREFIEWAVTFIVNLAITIFLLEWLVFPFPSIPKPKSPVSGFAALDLLKPSFLHMFAMCGILLFAIRPLALKDYVHAVFTVIVKARNYLKFVRDSKSKIST
jgi:hypothetical protein